MSAEKTLHCTLTTQEQSIRRSRVRDTITAHVTAAISINDGLRLEFDDSSGLRELLNGFVLLESECCSFLSFTLSQPPDKLSLLIEGPPGAADVIELFRKSILDLEH